VVLFVGDTVVVFVVELLVLHVYVSAPLADNVTAVPAQVVAFDTASVGNALTSIVIVSVVLAQPCDLLP
jgi:hypothetical protein